MNKMIKRILSIVLALSVMVTSTLSIYALEEELYLSDLRLIYAEDYSEAKTILKDSEFKDYKVLRENLNEDTGETGVWIAYKSTTDIEDAITDISIMQMNGGYNVGNYQEMIKQSYEEYKKMGRTYLQAIAYYKKAYDAGHYLASIARRQLNFYTIETDPDLGIKIPDFEGALLGDIFYEGVSESELATMFMEGNSYVLQNVRSLLAMGVSYNEDGKTYLEKVQDSATNMNANPNVFANKGYNDLANNIAGTILTFRKMFEELSSVEAELDYYDEDLTEKEIEFSEYKSIAERLKDVTYLNGKTLYDFCLTFEHNEEDVSSLYPLVDALNKGQIAMTEVMHYYDVVRYCMSDYPEEMLEEQIAEQEAFYAEMPFNLYAGVDRSIYNASFALTSDAYRADAYTEEGLAGYMFHEKPLLTITGIVSGAASVGFAVWAILRTTAAKKAAVSADMARQMTIDSAKKALGLVEKTTQNTIAAKSSSSLVGVGNMYGKTYGQTINALFKQYYPNLDSGVHLDLKLDALMHKSKELTQPQLDAVSYIQKDYATTLETAKVQARQAVKDAQNATVATASKGMGLATGALYVVSAITFLYMAFSIGYSIFSYYHPDYDDIPVAMVDLINTVDGDRYIKYEVVREVEAQKNGEYIAGDLNAFSAERWNALYYTKSYEAGKPLLADEFYVSNSNNKPKENYAPVHRFGEVICYDLNKYNFDYETSIYLSVKQSENNKSAVADIPELIGSIFSSGYVFVAAGVGVILGAFGTLGTQSAIKKKKSKKEEE